MQNTKTKVIKIKLTLNKRGAAIHKILNNTLWRNLTVAEYMKLIGLINPLLKSHV